MKKRLLSGAIHIVIYVGALMMILPFLWMLSTSLKLPNEVFSIPIQWIPKNITFSNFKTAINGFPFFRFLFNTVFVTLGILGFQLLTSIFAGYAFARLEFKGKNFLFMLLLSALMLPSQTIMIPMILMLKKFNLLNSLAGLIIPFGWSALIVFLFRQFFIGIPKEIEEAAQIDGCTTLRTIFSIIIPMSKPIIATATILIFVYGWNQYFWPLLILSDEKLFTLQLGLSYFKEQSMIETNWGALMAAASLVVLPVIVVFLFFRKHIIQSIAFSGGKE